MRRRQMVVVVGGLLVCVLLGLSFLLQESEYSGLVRKIESGGEKLGIINKQVSDGKLLIGVVVLGFEKYDEKIEDAQFQGRIVMLSKNRLGRQVIIKSPALIIVGGKSYYAGQTSDYDGLLENQRRISIDSVDYLYQPGTVGYFEISNNLEAWYMFQDGLRAGELDRQVIKDRLVASKYYLNKYDYLNSFLEKDSRELSAEILGQLTVIESAKIELGKDVMSKYSTTLGGLYKEDVGSL